MSGPSGEGVPLRSARWFAGHDVAGLLHRASVRATGTSPQDLGERPVVGICNPWSDLVSCNLHFRALAAAVRRGVVDAGGIAFEFPTISLGENLMKPTSMLYRNLMAMDVEESIRSYPFDAVVLLGGCDKSVPAELMGAASAGVPAIMVTGGPCGPAHFRGRELGVGTDIWQYTDDVRAGRMTLEEYAELEAAVIPSYGHCSEMGTASTMASICEVLGMTLPQTAAIPALEARRHHAAEASGRRAVELATAGLRPADVLCAAAFDNAITALMAIGGSTNAVVHLIAIANRVGIDLRLDRFEEISRRTPVIANVRPSGEHLFEAIERAGGIPALLRELGDLIDPSVHTVSGRTLGEQIAKAENLDRDVIRSVAEPLRPRGGIGVVRGSLAPDGALIKLSTASPELLRHRGRALVFESVYDVAARIDDESLEVDETSVLVLRNSGPHGGPGMPEWGQIPVPAKLLRKGVEDMVRISDARMSGTAFGTVILHVAPESAVGGPLLAVRDGDPIVLDVESGRLDLELSSEEIAKRLAKAPLPAPKYTRGYGALFLQHVMQADKGCDFDVLRDDGADVSTEPHGILRGWIGGW
ncbi:MAG: dihydroxy-acid dehydratase [Gaiellales bacterium]